ncbi:hypothetical protein ABZY03_30550 [Streptomyces klenkii]|uniref:hypothetical protein n=1 Tax=Streptomyces klenkii TaxID=1420899 RepID=UPI0033ACF437
MEPRPETTRPHTTEHSGTTLRAELLAPQDLAVPGEQASADLIVCNDGHIVDAYEMELIGPPAAWDNHRLGRVVVFPGTSE